MSGRALVQLTPTQAIVCPEATDPLHHGPLLLLEPRELGFAIAQRALGVALVARSDHDAP